MRQGIDGDKLHIILPKELLNDLQEAKEILGKDRSSHIRSAIIQYITDLRLSGKLPELNTHKEKGVIKKDTK